MVSGLRPTAPMPATFIVPKPRLAEDRPDLDLHLDREDLAERSGLKPGRVAAAPYERLSPG
jgi:hypothetical protein